MTLCPPQQRWKAEGGDLPEKERSAGGGSISGCWAALPPPPRSPELPRARPFHRRVQEPEPRGDGPDKKAGRGSASDGAHLALAALPCPAQPGAPRRLAAPRSSLPAPSLPSSSPLGPPRPSTRLPRPRAWRSRALRPPPPRARLQVSPKPSPGWRDRRRERAACYRCRGGQVWTWERGGGGVRKRTVPRWGGGQP